MKKIISLIKNFCEITRILWSSSKIMTILLIFNNLSRNAIWPLRALVVKNIIEIILLSLNNSFEPYKITFIINMILFFVFFWLNRIWWPLNSYTQTLMLAKVSNNMKLRIIKAMENIELSFFDKSENYDIYNQALQQTDGRQPINTVNNILSLFSLVISFFTAFFLMISINSVVATILILSSVPSLIWENQFNKKAYEFDKDTIKERRRLDYIFGLFTGKASAKEIKAFRSDDYLVKKHADTLDNYNKKYFMLFNSKIKYDSLFWIILQIALMFSYYLIISQVSKSVLPISDLSFFLSIAVSLQNAIKKMGSNMNNIISSNRYLGNLLKFEIMNEKQFQNDTIQLPKEIKEIEFKNVSFRYPSSNRDVIKNINFKIVAPTNIVLVGENGSGKTTLIKLLLGFYQPSEGEILINGTRLNKFDINEYHRLFSVCFQDYQKYGFTLRDNIVMADAAINENEFSKIVNSLSLNNLIESLPDKENTYLSREYDEKGTELSGGQYNKIAIARAIAKKAQIVLFDEPTASLDAKAERELFLLYKNLCSDKIGVMITHRLSTAVSSDRIFVLKDGELIEQGSHYQLMSRNGEYAQMFYTQSKQYAEVK